jgi:hypothetical protein
MKPDFWRRLARAGGLLLAAVLLLAWLTAPGPQAEPPPGEVPAKGRPVTGL